MLVKGRAPKRSISARGFILVLLVALALPGICFGIFLLTSYSDSEHRRFGQESMRISSLIGRVMDGELQGLLAELRGLSSSTRLRDGDFAGFYEEARQLIADRPFVILLRDRERRQVLNTQVPFGQAVPPAVALTPEQREAFDEGKPVVGNVYASPISGEFRVPVALPVMIGDVGYILAITVPTSYLRDVLVTAVPPGWTVAVGDRAGTIVTRSERHEALTGKPGIAEYLRQASGGSGTFRAVGFDGVELVAGYLRSPFSGWLYAANIPVAVIEAPSLSTLRGFLIAGSVAVALSIAIALLFAQRFTAVARQLARQAHTLGEGGAVVRPQTGIHEFDRVAEALEQASDRRRLAEDLVRSRSQELEVILDTVPAAVWFTYGSDVQVVRRNRFANELMQVASDDTSSFASRAPAMAHLRVMKDGVECAPDQLPLQRALRGMEPSDEEFVFRFADGTERILLTSARPLRGAGGEISGAVSVSIDITERHRAEEQRQLLTNELNHRVKNALATFQSIAVHTLRGASNTKAAEQALTMRLAALSAAHGALTRENWVGADLRDLVDTVIMQPHLGTARRFSAGGPRLWLPPSLALSMTLALHELMTNALKYGALSHENGQVSVKWEDDDRAGVRRLLLDWTERDGPPVVPPERTGFGTRLLNRLFGPEGGEVSIAYRPEGLHCRIEVPLPARNEPPATRVQLLEPTPAE